MVFYNKILRAYVLIELKTTKLTPEAAGQINMYLNYYAKGIAETACLITTFDRIFIVNTEFHLRGFNEANDFFVVRGDLYFPEDSVFCPDGGFHCT